MPEQAPIDDPSKRPPITGEQFVEYLDSLGRENKPPPSPKESEVFHKIAEREKPSTHEGEVLK